MDSVADFFIRIKNSTLAGRAILSVPFSKFKHELAQTLIKNNFLEKIELKEEGKKKSLILSLCRTGGKVERIEIKIVSKPGRRVYLKAKDLKKLRGQWTTIISAPAGLMEAKEALRKNYGGEVICRIRKI